jgi:LmbE family N-acetylglucosaminyl deacetylase
MSAKMNLNSLIVVLFAGDPGPKETLSAIAKKIHQRWGLSAEKAYSVRREEEKTAMTILDVDYAWLDWPEIIYRDANLKSIKKIRDANIDTRENDPIFSDLSEFIDQLSELNPSARLVVPLSIGSHRDHRVTTDVVRLHSDNVIFYEDFPYCVFYPDEIDLNAKKHRLVSKEIDISSVFENRVEACLAYQSQIVELFGSETEMVETIRKYYSSNGRIVENYWAAKDDLLDFLN